MIVFAPLSEFPREAGAHEVQVPFGLDRKADLLEFLRGALRLPDYFGANWDALEECLNDPHVMGGRKCVLVHRDLPLAGDPAGRRAYLQILRQAARNSTSFDVVFPEAHRTQVLAES